LEPCEAGRFSAYIDENLNVLHCSFMIPQESQNLNDKELSDIWQEGAQFQYIRKRLSEADCKNCKFIKNCLGGCPIYPEINLCGFPTS
jgi:radical SAM protein with 4Fe4S-binding SPASM domain